MLRTTYQARADFFALNTQSPKNLRTKGYSQDGTSDKYFEWKELREKRRGNQIYEGPFGRAKKATQRHERIQVA